MGGVSQPSESARGAVLTLREAASATGVSSARSNASNPTSHTPTGTVLGHGRCPCPICSAPGSSCELVVFLQSIIDMATASRDSMEVLNQFAGVAGSLGSISKALRRPGRQMAAAIGTMANAVALIDGWESEARGIRSRLEALAEEPSVN